MDDERCSRFPFPTDGFLCCSYGRSISVCRSGSPAYTEALRSSWWGGGKGRGEEMVRDQVVDLNHDDDVDRQTDRHIERRGGWQERKKDFPERKRDVSIFFYIENIF